MALFLALIPGGGPLLALGARLFAWLLNCVPCLVALAVVGAFIAGNVHGHRKEAAKCRAADLTMQLAAQKRDADIARSAAATAALQAAALQTKTDQLQKQVSDYEATLQKRPGCILSADDVKRLRNIR